MTAITFSLVLLICGPITGCTEIPYGAGYSHIGCLMRGAEAVQQGRADTFRCRHEQGEKA